MWEKQVSFLSSIKVEQSLLQMINGSFDANKILLKVSSVHGMFSAIALAFGPQEMLSNTQGHLHPLIT
jgi:hypothetical protein